MSGMSLFIPVVLPAVDVFLYHILSFLPLTDTQGGFKK